jgi:hypothetical protein
VEAAHLVLLPLLLGVVCRSLQLLFLQWSAVQSLLRHTLLLLLLLLLVVVWLLLLCFQHATCSEQ